MTEDIPLIDLAELENPTAEVADKLRRGFGEFGLVFLSGHDLGPEATGPLYDEFLSFLDAPSELKERFRRGDIWFQRGWTPPNTEQAVVAGGQPDFKECWFAMVEEPRAELTAEYPELFAGNLWPDDRPNFESHYLAVGKRLQSIGRLLLKAAAQSLGLPEDALAELVEGGAHVTRALKYLPLSDEEIAEGVLWGEEHTDFNLITLLPGGRFFDQSGTTITPPDDGSGLYLRCPANEEHPQGRLIRGRAPAGSIVCQVGQELEILSGGRFLATPHVVRAAKKEGVGRCSIAHFVHVHPHTRLYPMAPFRDEETIARYRPSVTAGTYAAKTMVDIGLAPSEVVQRFGYRHYERLASTRTEEA